MGECPDVKSTSYPDPDVVQVDFRVAVDGESVPCVLWKPARGAGPRTLIAMGHGGAQHKKTRGIRDRATRYAKRFGWASVAIDAPRHGDRVTSEEAESERRNTRARVAGESSATSLSVADKIRFLDTLAEQSVPEWRGALDKTLECFTQRVDSIGYWGVSQGTWIGVPLLAEEARFECAVLGLSQLHPDHVAFRRAAERVRVPLRFVVQWDDPIRSRDHGIALFDAFGSREKSMHVYPGGHADVPDAESGAWDDFFRSHLDRPESDGVRDQLRRGAPDRPCSDEDLHPRAGETMRRARLADGSNR